MGPCPWPCGASRINYPDIREGSLAQAEASRSIAAGPAWCFFVELEVTVASLVRDVLWLGH